MRHRGRRIPIAVIGAGVLVWCLAHGEPAAASEPVPRTLDGCVRDGVFITADGYTIDARQPDGGALNLDALEGHRITMSGSLLPGDRFIVHGRPRDRGRCTR